VSGVRRNVLLEKSIANMIGIE